jgi:hypothetical protein
VAFDQLLIFFFAPRFSGALRKNGFLLLSFQRRFERLDSKGKSTDILRILVRAIFGKNFAGFRVHKRELSADAKAACSSESESECVVQRRRNWAALIRLVYEVDPLLCPNCHSKMDIVSVIKDGKVIDKILAHLQYKFDPLPLSIRPPPDTPTEWDSHFI